MELDPASWALVHDRRQARHFAFWRGLELCVEICAERLRPGGLWADVGCGTGHLAAALSGLGARVVGLDRDPAMARYARRRWCVVPRWEALPSPDAELPRRSDPGAWRAFAAAEASRLPLADGSCAGLVAISLLGCLAEPGSFFAEAARVLAPGGTLCVSAMNRRSLLLAVSKAWGWRPGRRSPRYTAYDPAALAAALRRAGLVPERQILYGHFAGGGHRVVPPPAAARRLERAAPPGRRTAWARQLLLVARRPA